MVIMVSTTHACIHPNPKNFPLYGVYICAYVGCTCCTEMTFSNYIIYTLLHRSVYNLVHCREFTRTIPRPFSLRYNSYTQSIEFINDKALVAKLVEDIKCEVDILEDALTKL